MRSLIATIGGVLIAGTLLLASPAAAASELTDSVPFEIIVTSWENEIHVEAVSGCLFESVAYASGERPGRSAWLTESGIAGPAHTGGAPGGSARPPESEQFEMVLYFSADGVRAESVTGCLWKELVWWCGEGTSCRARVTTDGVHVLKSGD
jgi:hypothetical protein